MRPPTIAAAIVLVAAGALLAPAPTAPEGVTWSNQVARLFQEQCQGCHRPGDIAPFPLVTYGDAYRQHQKLLRAIELRKMPPWKPVPGFGEFTGVRRLSDADIALVKAWVAAGAPEGDPGQLPAPRQFAETWSLGAPDAVLTSEPFEVPPGKQDLYRCFVLPTSFPEDRYVSAVEFIPGNRQIVHHLLTYTDTKGQAEALDRADPGPGYTCFGGPGFLPSTMGVGGWAPGAPPQVSPDGTGILLPAGARVVLQVHYHNQGGSAQIDQSRIGLHFARRPVDKRLRAIPIANLGLQIPAGAERHVVRASYTVPPHVSFHAVAVSPHMHLLGREMKVTATQPNGTVRPLIHIADWDFHWQGTYNFAAPVPLPAGTRIDVEAVYDNSTRNRRNPNTPPRDVAWGEGTTDEMCIAFLRITVDSERLGHVPRYALTR